MPSFPDGPFCVPDTTPVCARVSMMNEMARTSVHDPSVHAFSQRVLARAREVYADAPAVPDAWERVLALEVMRAVQALGYVDRQGERDCYQLPSFTIAHSGECKALSTLFVAVATGVGLESEVVWIDQEGAPKNHVVSRVRAGGEWMWADCSIATARLGDSPYDALERGGDWSVVGGVNPAGSVRLSDMRDWDTLWRGWPEEWWRKHYPSAAPRVRPGARRLPARAWTASGVYVLT